MVVRIATTDAELAACFRLRRVVFVEEQGVSEEEEYDDRDGECTHFLALPSEDSPLLDAVGTARLWTTPEGLAKVQRVAVLASQRRLGVGRALMAAVEAEARRQGREAAILGAQLTAVPFYRRLGYETYGDEFLDAGIPHLMMRRDLRGQ